MHFTLTLISSHHLFSFFSLHTCIMPWSNYGRCFLKIWGWLCTMQFKGVVKNSSTQNIQYYSKKLILFSGHIHPESALCRCPQCHFSNLTRAAWTGCFTFLLCLQCWSEPPPSRGEAWMWCVKGNQGRNNMVTSPLWVSGSAQRLRHMGTESQTTAGARWALLQFF